MDPNSNINYRRKIGPLFRIMGNDVFTFLSQDLQEVLLHLPLHQTLLTWYPELRVFRSVGSVRHKDLQEVLLHLPLHLTLKTSFHLAQAVSQKKAMYVKFIYSEKATKFLQNLHLRFVLCTLYRVGHMSLNDFWRLPWGHGLIQIKILLIKKLLRYIPFKDYETDFW